MDTTRLSTSGALVRGFRVRVLEGGDAGRAVASDGDAVVKVGQSVGNTLVVRDPAVSRFHLRLTALAEHVRIEDVGSTNGSWYAGARFNQIELAGVADVAIGTTLIRVEPDAGGAHRLDAEDGFGPLRGRSAAMQRAIRHLREAARSREIPVLLLGETGTGKEVAARAIHDESPRRRAPFVVINCAGLSPTLIESELFGHVKGAFTDAREARPGPFELADGGTVFIDEVAELPAAQQTRLLRVLQERAVQRMGARAETRVDVRIVAATRRDLLEEINAGRFREDLYFRLAGTEVVLPPLRERLDEIPDLVEGFARALSARDPGLHARTVPADVVEAMSKLRWPGNIRELLHTVHRYLVHGELLIARGSAWTSPAIERLQIDDLLSMSIEEATAEFQARMIRYVIAQKGSQARALPQLGVDRSTAYRMRKKAESGAKRRG